MSLKYFKKSLEIGENLKVVQQRWHYHLGKHWAAAACDLLCSTDEDICHTYTEYHGNLLSCLTLTLWCDNKTTNKKLQIYFILQ